jgi:putative ABC transport system permease protein
MRQILSDAIAPQRLTMLLLALFAGIALLLAIVGIYGVISYSVTQRKHEIGIRMALGASRGRVMWMVAGQAMALALTGEVLGLAGTLALRRLIGSQLYGSTATDPLVLAAVPLGLAAVSFVAAFVPARRAMQVNPLTALRHE